MDNVCAAMSLPLGNSALCDVINDWKGELTEHISVRSL
jgi:hypothetical protein